MSDTAPTTPRKYRPTKGDKRYGRSAISNGTKLLPGVDGRNKWARRARDLLEEFMSDLDVNTLSPREKSALRRAAAIATELEILETRFALGTAASGDLGEYTRATGALKRMFEAVGFARKTKDITPMNLENYLAAKRQREAEQAKAKQSETETTVI